MTTKRYLSGKRTASQNISISPALKDWVDRYVKSMQKNNPDDERYKSLSSFYCAVMENVLGSFEQGKSLDDFDTFLDKDIRAAFDEFTMKTVVHYYEAGVELNRFNKMKFKETMIYQLTWLNMFRKSVDALDLGTVKVFFDRMRNFYMENGQTTVFRIDLSSIKSSKHFTAVIEFATKTRNIHYENCKYLGYFLSVVGMQFTDFLYSEKDFSARFELKSTDIFFRKDLARKEKLKLMEYNLRYMTNYFRVVNDKDYYLWMKMAEDNDAYINFKSEKARNKMFELIEEDLRLFGTNKDFSSSILKCFERLHWISIVNSDKSSFIIELSEKTHQSDIEFLINYLSKFTQVVEEKGIYYLR